MSPDSCLLVPADVTLRCTGQAAAFTDLAELTSRADMGFKNLARSRQVVHEVWNRNQNGQVMVDWLDVIQEWDWELYLV